MTARTTTPDRAEISRQNGRKSRGPGPEGQRRSRMNAVKHGLTAKIPVLPGEDECTYRILVTNFLAALDPHNAVEVVLAEQAALASWKIARAERAECSRVGLALRAIEAAAGRETHDEIAAMGHWLLTDTLRARQNAAASLFPFLSEDRQDPFRRGRGDPRHIVLRLEATADGCQWLLDQWARLGARLERGRDWRTNELILALQLRGQRPLGADLLEWEGLLESTPADGEPEVIAQTRRALVLQLDEGARGDPAGQRGVAAAGAGGGRATAPAAGGAPAARGGRPVRSGRPAGGGHDGGRGADAAVPARFRPQAAPGAPHPAEAPPGRGCRRRRRSGARRHP